MQTLTSRLPSPQGWLNHRNAAEGAIIMELFEASFPEIYRYACQSLTFKMDVLEAFVIRQVRTVSWTPETFCLNHRLGARKSC